MNTVIFIYPNADDLWNTQIFPVGLTPSTSSEGDVVLGRLLDVSTIVKSVSILENRGLDDVEFSGVGGVAKVSDFTFTINNFDSLMDPLQFLGRTVKVGLIPDNDTTISITDNCRFVGYISKIDKGCFDIVLTVSDSLNKTLNNEVGAEISEGVITPINYGWFHDTEMPGVFNNNSIIIDSETTGIVEHIGVYDKGIDDFYKILRDDLTVVNGVIPFEDDFNDLLKLLLPITDTTGEGVTIYSPYSRAYLPFSDTTGLAVGDVYSYTVSSDEVRIKLLRIQDGYLIFEDLNGTGGAPVPPDTGDLTFVSGSGPTTITYSFVSEIIDPYIYYEADTYDGTAMSLKASRCLFKIDNEIFQVKAEPVVLLYGALFYQYYCTVYIVGRGVDGTIAATHVVDSIITVVKDENSNQSSLDNRFFTKDGKWLFEAGFFLKSVSGFKSKSTSVTPTITHTLLELPHSESNSGDVLISKSSWPHDTQHDFFFELGFEKPDIEGSIVDMYIIGVIEPEVLTCSDEYVALYVSVGKGGLSVPDSLSNPVIKIGNWKNDVEGLIYNPSSNIANPKYFAGSVDYPCLLNHDPIEGGSLLTTPTFSGFIAFDSKVSDSSTYNRRTWFNNISTGKNLLKCYSLANIRPSATGFTALDGRLSSLNELGDAKYFLRLSTKVDGSADRSVSVKYHFGFIGLYISFFLDFTKLTDNIWVAGFGRLDPITTYLIHSPEDVLKDLLAREYNLTSAADNYPIDSFYTTLSIYGERKSVFSTIEDFCKKHGLIITQNNNGECKIKNCLLESFDPDTARNITDTDIILKNPPYEQEFTEVDSLISSITQKYCYRKASDKFIRSYNTVPYASKYLITDREVTFKNKYVEQVASSELLAESLLNFYKEPIRILKIDILLNPATVYNIGEWLTIYSNVIPDTGNKAYLIVGVEDQLPCGDHEPYTKLTLLELLNINSVYTLENNGVFEHEDYSISQF